MRDRPKAVTPFGGLVVFIELPQRIGYATQVQARLPFRLTRFNALDPARMLTAFIFAVVVGGTALCPQRTAAGGSGVARPVGDERLSGP